MVLIRKCITFLIPLLVICGLMLSGCASSEKNASNSASPTAQGSSTSASATATFKKLTAPPKEGDSVAFGNYYSYNTKKPIVWYVLKVDGDKTWLLSYSLLEYRRFHEKDASVPWSGSTLRTWLNDTFLKQAFSAEEQTAIDTTTVFNSDRSTEDKVFLLSADEVKIYQSVPQAHGTAYTNLLGMPDIYYFWWTRTQGTPFNGMATSKALLVGMENKTIDEYVYAQAGVRPSVWVKTSALSQVPATGTPVATVKGPVKTSGAFNYMLSGDEAAIASYTGSESAVTIPTTLDGHPVTKIDDIAFRDNKTLSSLVIGQGITVIGDAAFLGCPKLTSVQLPAGLISIGYNAFESCRKLTDINFPDSLTIIGAGAFSGTALKNVALPAGTVVLEDAFDRMALPSAAAPSTTVPSPAASAPTTAPTELTVNKGYLSQLFITQGELQKILGSAKPEIESASVYTMKNPTNNVVYYFKTSNGAVSNSDLCYKIQAPIKALVPTLAGTISLDDFVSKLTTFSGKATYEVKKGSGTASTISDLYAQVNFSGVKGYGHALLIDVTGGKSVFPESMAWLILTAG